MDSMDPHLQIFLDSTPSNFTYSAGMLMPDIFYYTPPANADSCLSTTSGSTLAIGEIVNLYPRVLLVETTPPSTLMLSLSGAMKIINTTWILGSR